MESLLNLLEQCLCDDSPPIVRMIKKDTRFIVSYIRSLEKQVREQEEKLQVAREDLGKSKLLTKEWKKMYYELKAEALSHLQSSPPTV